MFRSITQKMQFLLKIKQNDSQIIRNHLFQYLSFCMDSHSYNIQYIQQTFYEFFERYCSAIAITLKEFLVFLSFFFYFGYSWNEQNFPNFQVNTYQTL